MDLRAEWKALMDSLKTPVSEATRARVWLLLLDSDFGERYYQEIAARVSRRERQLQGAQFVLSSGALATLLSGVQPIWRTIVPLAAALLSGVLLIQKLSRASGTAAQLQDGWADLALKAESFWARLGSFSDEDALAELEKLSVTEKALNSKATQTFPSDDFKTLQKTCWDSMLRDRGLPLPATS
jgi:hypothetical protein